MLLAWETGAGGIHSTVQLAAADGDADAEEGTILYPQPLLAMYTLLRCPARR
jgi:hypothetical protein